MIVIPTVFCRYCIRHNILFNFIYFQEKRFPHHQEPYNHHLPIEETHNINLDSRRVTLLIVGQTPSPEFYLFLLRKCR